MTTVHEQLVTLFLEAMPDLTPADLQDARVGSPSHWDSIAHVTVLALIEDTLGIRFRDDELDDLISFAAIETAVLGRVGAQAAKD